MAMALASVSVSGPSRAASEGSVRAAETPRIFEPGPAWASAWGAGPQDVERVRIQWHLRNVERTLRSETPVGLSDERRAARENALDALQTYWRAGEFPKNRHVPDRRVPYFIDDDGVACAVGHLMIASGADDIAREIATYENEAFVADIAHPELAGWLESNGITFAEAAWIQPTYGPCGSSYAPVCGSDDVTYRCTEVAKQCAGVQVAHQGWCEDDVEEGETGNHDAVLGEEICDQPSQHDCAVGSRSTPVGLLVLFALTVFRRPRRVRTVARNRR
jgi:hypothetical protein